MHAEEASCTGAALLWNSTSVRPGASKGMSLPTLTHTTCFFGVSQPQPVLKAVIYPTAHCLRLWKMMLLQVKRSSLTDGYVLGLERFAVPHVLHRHHQVVVGGTGPDVSEADKVFVLKKNTHRLGRSG